MKALTLTQPWATLVAIGAKKIETRSWNTNYRGPLAIHAAKGFPQSAQEECFTVPFRDYLGKYIKTGETYLGHHTFPLGAIVAICTLVHVKQMNELHVHPACQAYWWNKKEWKLDKRERAFGHYEVGRYMWLLEDVVMLAEPITAKGALGLWNWEAEMEVV